MENLSMSYALRIASLLVFICFLESGMAEEVAESPQPKAEANAKEKDWDATVKLTYYFDSRDYNTLNIFTNVKPLPLGFEFWGFTDIHSDQKAPESRFDLTRYFMEYRLIYPIQPDWIFGLKGFELEAEYNDFNGPNNNIVRFGPTYKHPLPLPWGRKGALRWRIHPFETGGDGFQASVLYFIPLTERFSVTGFADINFVDNARDRWVIEPQLNFKINQMFALVLELRYNEFEEANPNLDGLGVAAGLSLDF